MPPRDIRQFVCASPIVRAPITRAVEVLADQLPGGARVLDAGAGTAPYRSLFAHCRYETQDWANSPHGADASADIVSDLSSLPLADDTYDAVVLTEVLEHLSDPHGVLRELRRVLRPDGRLLLSVPFVGELHEEPYDYYRYTSHGLRHLLVATGFRIEQLQPLGGWYSTLAHVLRHQGLSTAPIDRPSTFVPRLIAMGFLAISTLLRRFAPILDRRLDTRKALPLGWLAIAAPDDEQAQKG